MSLNSMSSWVLEYIAKKLGLCGEGKDLNWSVIIADHFFIDCGCCWFWRGAMFGALLASVAILVATLGVTAVFEILKRL
jgi:hypothetical protein